MVFFGLIFLVLSSTLLLHFNHISAQTHISEFCLGGNYFTNSTYQANLNSLLSLISNSDALDSSRHYYNYVGKDPDTVYVLFQCRGDFSSEVCKKCARIAAEEVITKCQYNKASVIFYDECWLHYSNNSLIQNVRDDAAEQYDPTIYVTNINNVTDPSWFRLILSDFMGSLVNQAVDNSQNFFATSEVKYKSFEKIYGLAQCAEYIMSSWECNNCLRRSVDGLTQCCYASTGGNVLNPSCNIRYEFYPFYQSNAVVVASLPTLQRTSPPNTTTNRGPETDSSNTRPGPETDSSKTEPGPETDSSKTRPGTETDISRTRPKLKTKPSKIVVAIIVVSAVMAVIPISTLAIYLYLRRMKGPEKKVDDIGNAEQLQFNLRTVRDATNNFCDTNNNKLGKGGFGIVYKGMLLDGKEIAVKRLSRNSGQGEEEFKNEVLLIVKVQHINLGKLLGYCLEGDEKLLIYEFAANKSLDNYIFDPIKRTCLDWERRYKIIVGIARGLLYLHEDSRHRIIHRDLKAGNILLDAQMEPKISDFGMARLFGVDQIEGSSGRIVGTYGYMAPEYPIHGQFSVKSDVFSFGILVLEVLSGQKKTSFFHSEHDDNLTSYVSIL